MKFPAPSRSLKQAKSSLPKDRAKNELLLKHCLRTLSQKHQESPNCSQHGQIFTYLSQKQKGEKLF